MATPAVTQPGPLTVYMEIEGPNERILNAIEVIYEFKYEHQLEALTDFQEERVTLEFRVATSLQKEVAVLTTRLKAYGLRVHSSWIDE